MARIACFFSPNNNNKYKTGVNEAFNTLKSPVKRAIYLLEESGVISKTDEDKTVTDPVVLMEAME